MEKYLRLGQTTIFALFGAWLISQDDAGLILGGVISLTASGLYFVLACIANYAEARKNG
jgi:hypothetical protein